METIHQGFFRVRLSVNPCLCVGLYSKENEPGSVAAMTLTYPLDHLSPYYLKDQNRSSQGHCTHVVGLGQGLITMSRRLGDCNGLTDTASASQYPRGTCGSGLPDPEVLLSSSKPERLPGEGGIRKSLIRASGRRQGGEESKEDHGEPGQEEKEDRGKWLKNSDEPSESRDQHRRTSTQQAAHDTGRAFSEAGIGGPGGGNTENPATLWGEHALAEEQRLEGRGTETGREIREPQKSQSEPEEK
ncbi:hypothetical protein NDU88_001837 [Pleurodeles waltl]|uniref:Uncharacterized protein n=1 Tax=Pleurodeles waltl TaxID=8319 RepID=A0AAV7VCV2_PLEWA|nr:hypothetical protein NDU88_001837 [Pleurodeles waltl]